MHEVAAVGEREALALGAAGGDDGAHAGGLPDDVGADVAGDELHRVDDAEPGGDAAAGRIHVEVDVGVAILVGEEEDLSDDQRGDLVADGRTQEDDAVLQQARVDVVRALAAAGVFDDDGNEVGQGGLQMAKGLNFQMAK